MKKLFYIVLSILFLVFILIFPHILDFGLIRSVEGCSVFKECNFNVIRILQTSLNNIGYYGTSFSIIFAIITYFYQRNKDIAQQEERNKQILAQQQEKEKQYKKEKEKLEEELTRRQEEERKLRLKELEMYKDSFRPNFVLNVNATKLVVIMKKDDLFLENVRFYSNEKAEGTFYDSLKHRDEIDLEGSKNNYFITAETSVGEKIIFGRILNNIKVYKALRNGHLTIIPNRFKVLNKNQQDINQNIDDNWLSFNRGETEEHHKWIDINFMYKTVDIREKVSLNLTSHMLEIINKTTVKELFESTLANLSTNSYDYSIAIKQEVINKLIEILEENIDRILLNPTKIPESNWEYISRRTEIENTYTSDKEVALLWVVKQYSKDDYDESTIQNEISIFNMLVNHSIFKDEVNEHVEEYKVDILKCIEE